MAGKGFHHVDFIVTWKTRVDGRCEADPAPEGTHGRSGSGSQGRCRWVAVVVSGTVIRRII